MRHALNPQLQIGETIVSAIQFDIHSRVDIPQLLRGLQYLYDDTEVRDTVLEQLRIAVIATTDPIAGRPGMSLWSVLVPGVLRLGLNCNYDRVMELANEHRTLRQMLGHGHQLLGQKDHVLRGRCDSFVVETDVDFPTDIKLLVDAMHQ